MAGLRTRLWLVAKTVLAVGIVAAVGLQFARILRQPALNPYPFDLRVGYLVPAGVLYLLAHCCWGSFWVRLLRSQGVHVGLVYGLRAYFVSQYGKYVPGKAWVVFIRVALLRGVDGGRPLAVGVTATYETLTSMAAGALLAAALIPRLGVLPEAVSPNVGWVVALALLPLALAVLNKLAARRVARLRGPGGVPLPSPPLGLLAQGMVHGVVGWALLGLCVSLGVAAVVPGDPGWQPAAHYPADVGAMALAYVSGFFVLVAPGGLGVRELLLEAAIRPRFAPDLGAEVAAGLGVVIALVLRFAWTLAEVVVVLGLYFFCRPPAAAPPPADHGPTNA
ncbi:MAG TPA: hypothetical protein VH092_05145 [Urbifossiella sp.]|jgi:hypothetical protein|nr:hypothetical protein [Urbifossiella sp.]